MAKLYLTPNKYSRKLAEQRNMDVNEFINKYNVNLNEPRARSKYGIYLQDFLIERNDGSYFSINEEPSECEGLKKLIITLYGELYYPMPNEITAYLDDVNYEKLQNDSNYLDTFGDGLLSQKRISDKYSLSNIDNIVYLGKVIPDKDNPGKYVKGAHNEFKMLEYINSNLKRVEQQKINQQKEQENRKEALKNAIYPNIAIADLQKLEQIAEILGIELLQKNNIPGNNTQSDGR